MSELRASRCHKKSPFAPFANKSSRGGGNRECSGERSANIAPERFVSGSRYELVLLTMHLIVVQRVMLQRIVVELFPRRWKGVSSSVRWNGWMDRQMGQCGGDRELIGKLIIRVIQGN